MVEVEGILNSRPLTYCSRDPNDEHVFTPNNFLHGQIGGQLAPRVIDDLAFNPRNRWRLTQDLISKCWKRLMKEYLSTLNTRNKWVEEKRNITPRLRVDPLSLNPPCVMRLVRRVWKKKWSREILRARSTRASRPRISRGYFFFRGFLSRRVTHDGLSDRGTTRSLHCPR